MTKEHCLVAVGDDEIFQIFDLVHFYFISVYIFFLFMVNIGGMKLYEFVKFI